MDHADAPCRGRRGGSTPLDRRRSSALLLAGLAYAMQAFAMWLLAAAPARLLGLYALLAAAGLVGTAAVNWFTSDDGRQPAGGVQSRGHQQPQALQIS